jgi:type II secretory pathway predicted ATPase ExeA
VPYDAQMAEAAASARAELALNLRLGPLYHGQSGPCNRTAAIQGVIAARLNPAIAMFLEAFGLDRDPFLDTADPAFYYDTLPGAYGRRRLAECLAQGRGLAVVVGPIGAGKTTLFNAVEQDLLADARNLVGVILDPSFASEAELLVAIADSFGFGVDPDAPTRVIKDALKRALFESAAQARQPMLFIDEAQLLPEPYLESLRALLNYQLDDRKLLAIALSGQPELAAAVLRHPNFSDRVALWLELAPLSEAESAGLVHHRLRCAGFAGERSPFDDDALHALWAHGHGIPRRLTTLAREAMEVSSAYSRREVRKADVDMAVKRIVPLAAPAATVSQAARSNEPRRWWQWWRNAS